MFAKGPDAEERERLKQWGFDPDDDNEPPLVVWPENRQAVVVFLAMRTQWRVGMGGFTGMDYAALPEVWRRTKTPPGDRDEIFEALRVMEIGALNEINKASD